MQVGGQRQLQIPAQLGYGSRRGRGDSAQRDLVFDVALVEVSSDQRRSSPSRRRKRARSPRCAPLGAERVGLSAALGRVLAETCARPATCRRTTTRRWTASRVRTADAERRASCGSSARSPPGHVATRALAAGEAYRIMTGAPIPPGADAVVMQEQARRRRRVRLSARCRWAARARRGEDVRAGAVVLWPGVTLAPAELGILASAQRASVAVTRRPGWRSCDRRRAARRRSAARSRRHRRHQQLHARGAGAQGGRRAARPADRARRSRASRAAIDEARRADLIVSTGGVSVGAHDHVKAVLAELGAELTVWRVDMKPGKPVAIARLGRRPTSACRVIRSRRWWRSPVRAARRCAPRSAARSRSICRAPRALLDAPLTMRRRAAPVPARAAALRRVGRAARAADAAPGLGRRHLDARRERSRRRRRRARTSFAPARR